MRYGRSAPVDFAVIAFQEGRSPLAGPLATELASLEEAELVRLLDVVVVEKADDDAMTLHEVADLGDLGDLARMVPGLRRILSTAALEALVESVEPGRSAAVIVWENTWAEPLVAIAGECGGRVVADGRVAPVEVSPIGR